MREWSRSASLLISGRARSSLSAWQLLQAGRAQLFASVLTKPQFPSGQLWQLHLNPQTFLLSLFHNSITKGAWSQGCLIVSGKAGGKGKDESILFPYYLLFLKNFTALSQAHTNAEAEYECCRVLAPRGRGSRGRKK